MSPAPEWDHRGQPPEGDAHVRQQLASIDGNLFNGMPVDDRYESGVPEGQRGNSLAFIQMTGLTRPPLRGASHAIDGSLAQVPIYEDLNATGPVSFYEKGVADVDDTLGRDSLLGRLSDATLDVDLVPSQGLEPLAVEGAASRSAQAFRDIVAGLQRGELASEPDSEDAQADEPSESENLTPEANSLDLDGDESSAPYSGSTSGALLALVEELESMMGVPAEPTPLHEDGAPELSDTAVSGTEPDVPELDHLPATIEEDPGSSEASLAQDHPDAVSLSVPAAEIDDESFDALLSSLSGAPAAAADNNPPAVEDDFDALVEAEPPAADQDGAPPQSGLADEWDALLDTMSVRGLEPTPPAPAPEPEPEPAPEPEIQPELIIEIPPPPPSPRKLQSSGALAEAEQLMQALEKKPRPIPSAAPAPPVVEPVEAAPPKSAPYIPEPEVAAMAASADTGWVVPAVPPPAPPLRLPERESVTPISVGVPPVPGEHDGEPQLSYDYSAAPSRRRSRRHSRVARRSRKIVKAVFYVLLLGTLATTLWVFVAGPMLVKDEDLSERAERLMKSQEFDEASKTYLQLASRIAPGDPERANAEFRAAYALTLGPEHSDDETKMRYGTAVALFKKFTEDYPQHPKRARALSIMGRLYYESRDFEKAIAVLRDQVKPADDPAAALAMLRYLARAYSMTGNYEQAETSYLQAATLPGNYNAEADYLELGNMFRTRAEVAKDAADQEQLKSKAMDNWQRALKLPGLSPGDRTVLEEQLKWAAFTEQSGAANPAAGTTASGPAPTAAEAPAEPASAASTVEAPAPVVSPIPVPADEAGRAEVPGAELKALVPAAAPAAP